MKAWEVHTDYEPYSGIFFAETRGKAIYKAMQTDVIDVEDCSFTEIHAVRLKWADKYYNGKDYLDWANEEDKLVLVRDFGFHCIDDEFDTNECVCCNARKYCSLLEAKIENMDEFQLAGFSIDCGLHRYGEFCYARENDEVELNLANREVRESLRKEINEFVKGEEQ